MLALGAPAALAAVPGGNGRIAFESEGTIYSINPDGSGRTALTRGANPTWSADGARIAFEREDASGVPHVWTMDADGGNQREVAEGADPAWSPDGRRLAYSAPDPSVEGNLSSIYVVDADGSNRSVLAAASGSSTRNYSPAWSPDGREVAYLQFYQEVGEVRVVVDVDDPSERSVAPGDGPPDWSPDGTRLAAWVDPCLGECPERVGLYEIDTHAEWPALSRFFGDVGYGDSGGGASDSRPAYSPDGWFLVFRAGDGDLSLLRLSDGSVTEVTDDQGRPVAGEAPSWQPLRRPTAEAQCKRGGWRDWGGFRNQGDCLRYVVSGKQGR